MKTLSLARDFGSNALDFGMERKKTVLAVIGGIAILAVAGVIVSRVLRARAAARSERGDELERPEAGHGKGAIRPNVGKGAGSSASMAKAAVES